MRILIPVAMFGFLPFCMLLFATFKARHAAMMTFLIGWLFLPLASYAVPGFPDYTKHSAMALAALLGVMVFDNARLLRFRPRWFDIPIVIWCVSSFVSSMTNDLGAYDGAAAMAGKIITWGIPYLIGRLYFNDLKTLRELAIGIVCGAIVYVPIVVFESRMAPQLHDWIYGFWGRTNWEQSSLFGPLRWKPTGFVDSALALTFFMGVAAVLCYWLWRSRSIRQIVGLPMTLLVPGLFFAAMLCKAWTGNALMMGGVGVLYATASTRLRVFALALVAAAPLYMGLRSTGVWSGDGLVSAISLLSARRAGSLQTRFNHENTLAEKAWERPWFGWGGWGGNRVREEGRDVSLTDGMWMIAFGVNGWFGVIGFCAILILPLALFIRHYPVRWWTHPQVGPAAALAVMVAMYMMDCLLNAMLNPIWTVAAGGLMGLKGPVIQRRATTQSPPIAHQRRRAAASRLLASDKPSRTVSSAGSSEA